MSTLEDAKGPYVIWSNGGYEGWRPISYPDAKSALLAQEARYDSEWILTKVVNFEIVES